MAWPESEHKSIGRKMLVRDLVGGNGRFVLWRDDVRPRPDDWPEIAPSSRICIALRHRQSSGLHAARIPPIRATSSTSTGNRVTRISDGACR